ncbi:MAG: GAF domain-containing protein [Bacteroidetes bacterium]|nr:GAF domain-containing protein [Bacteroidota bacterium]MCB9044214.1 GAF domain-containing protein [Chitinophagales bacterium]
MEATIFVEKNWTKEEKYIHLLPQIQAVVAAETDLIANMANVCALLKTYFNFFWIGFYRVQENALVLGPFQGTLACTRIAWGKGVCGTAWQKAETIIVPDVEQFPGHIACSSASRSEIVVPGITNQMVTFVLDIDSEELAAFDEVDAIYLAKIVAYLS